MALPIEIYHSTPQQTCLHSHWHRLTLEAAQGQHLKNVTQAHQSFHGLRHQTCLQSMNRRLNQEWQVFLELSYQENHATSLQVGIMTLSGLSIAHQRMLSFANALWNIDLWEMDFEIGSTFRQASSKHENSKLHGLALRKLAAYRESHGPNRRRTVLNQMHGDVGSIAFTERNHQHVKVVLHIVLMCAKQDIPLREHREIEEALNRGNFLEIFKLISKYDPEVENRIQQPPWWCISDVGKQRGGCMFFWSKPSHKLFMYTATPIDWSWCYAQLLQCQEVSARILTRESAA